jgi:pilus assembly protein FimV
MAYGLYDQAADLITKALETEPENREFKLKLLEVYFVWGNKEEFLAAAMGLHQDIGQSGNADWDKVVIMGKQICPDEPLFSEATAAAPEIDLTLEASGVTTGLDFAFDGEGEEGDLDLDIGLGIVEDDDELNATNAAPAESIVEDDENETSAGASEFLDIGERTQAGLKAAFFEDMADDDEFAAPDVEDVDIEGAMAESESEEDASEFGFEDLESTQEAPAFEDESEDFAEGLTLEAPTVEADSAGAPTLAAPGLDAPTVETPMMDEATLEAPAFDPESLEEAEEIEAVEIEAEEEAEEVEVVEARVAATGDMSSVRLAAGGGGTEMTAEIEIDDLGLDVGEFDDLDVGGTEGASGTFSDLALDAFDADADDEQLSATGVTKVLDQPEDEIDSSADAEIDDDEATVMAPGFDIEVTGTSTEVLEQPVGDFDPDQPAAGEDLDFDDFSSALEGADTVERPAASDYRGRAAATASQGGSVTEMTGTTQIGPIDPQAMSEVGTKLDLARAYIDMGDPEGARSILEEVLNEGNDSQRDEAQSLLDSL